MTTVNVKTISGGAAGQVVLPATVFEAPENPVVVRETLNAFNTNQRQGTHSTKTRGFVSGGGIKPWKQKHTGRARAGSSRSPLWRHGATVFGPLPKDYREKVNQKKRQLAFRSVFTARAKAGRVIVVDDIAMASPRTREALAFLKAVGAEGRVLILTKGKNENLHLSTRNVPVVETRPVNAISIYDLLMADTVVLTKAALDEAGQLYGTI